MNLYIPLYETRIIPPGKYRAIIKQIIPKTSEKFNKEVIQIDYELTEYRFPDDEKITPVVRQVCSRSLHPKSRLAAILESLLKKIVTKADCIGGQFDLTKVIGFPCELELINKTTTTGNTITIVKNVLPST